jgi:hypothetical protein
VSAVDKKPLDTLAVFVAAVRNHHTWAVVAEQVPGTVVEGWIMDMVVDLGNLEEVPLHILSMTMGFAHRPAAAP